MNYNVRINEIKNQDSNVKAFATVTFDDQLVVCNISIVERKSGDGVFVSMPSYRTSMVDEFGIPEYKDICFPITSEFHKEFTTSILDAYEALKDGMLDKDGMNFGDGVDGIDYDVKMRLSDSKEGNSIRAYGQVTLDNCFVISNISIVEGKNGEFISMPSYKVGNSSKYRDIAFPITKEFRSELYKKILDSYQNELTMEKAMQQNAPAGLVAENRDFQENVKAYR